MRDHCICVLPLIDGLHERACGMSPNLDPAAAPVVLAERVAMEEREAAPGLAADNARLRALVKDAEWAGYWADSEVCPWCDVEKWSVGHGETCPAFTPEGQVK